MSRQRILSSPVRPTLWGASCLLGLLAVSCGGGDSADGSAAPAATASQPTAAKAENKGKGKGKAKQQALPKLSAANPAGARPEGIELPPDDPILGPALVINGEVVPHDEVRRQVIYGDRGRAAMETKKLSLIVEQEIARRVAEGADREAFRVSEAEAQKAIDETNEELKETYPDDEMRLEDLAPVGPDGILSQVMLSKLFMKVFMPDGHPSEYPVTTVAAFNNSKEGQDLYNALIKEYELQKDNDRELNPMFQQMVFQTLNEFLQETSDIRVGGGLPDGIALSVNGQEVSIQEMWDGIKDNVSISDVRYAKQWIVNMKLLEQDFGGDWLSEQEALEAWNEHAAAYENTMFPVDRMALLIKKFPSMQAYKDFRHAYSTHHKRIASELDAETLRNFANERTKLLIGQTQVDVDIILVSAYDFKSRRWLPNGWEDATARTEELLQRLRDGEIDWNEAVEQYSGFYDPPIPANGNVPANMRKAKGRFRGKTRNGLMQMIEESEYLQFLNGELISDYIFFRQEEGKVDGPFRGPYGWYVSLLRRRNVAPNNINMPEEKLIEMAEQDYTITSLSRYAQELIGRNQVYGLQ